MFNDFESDSAYWQEPDPFLVDLVSGFVNKGGMQLGITLFLHGMVVTGTLISEQDYLNTMSDMFANQAKKSLVKPTAQDLKTTEEVFDFTRLAEDLEPPPPPFPSAGQKASASQWISDESEELYDDEDAPILPPAIRHLHLKDPVIVQPQPHVSFTHSQISIIRLRLTSIDGWMIGKVAVDDDENNFMPPLGNDIRH